MPIVEKFVLTGKPTQVSSIVSSL